MKGSTFESLIEGFDKNLISINVDSRNFDFNWPIYRNSIIEDFRYFLSWGYPAKLTKILDIGIGVGLTSYILSNLGFNVSACDIKGKKWNMRVPFDQTAIFRAQFMQDIDFKYSKPDKLPFDNLSFDMIFLYAAIEHVEDSSLDSFVTELDRVLKQGGRVFIFKCPQKYSYSEFFVRKFLRSGHKYLLTVNRLRELFDKVNFTLEKCERYDFFPMILIQKGKPFASIFTSTLCFTERICALTPLRIFFHNIRCVFVKKKLEAEPHKNKHNVYNQLNNGKREIKVKA